MCNTDEIDGKIKNKNTSQKFNAKTARSSTTIVNEFEMKNFSNCREYEKMINTGKLCVYSSFPSVYHLLNSDEWMESYEKKTREKTERSSSRHAEKLKL